MTVTVQSMRPSGEGDPAAAVLSTQVFVISLILVVTLSVFGTPADSYHEIVLLRPPVTVVAIC